jgi:putative transposase
MSRRDYKGFAAGECYHVFNRGNNKADIFRDHADYKLFLCRLVENLYPAVENRDFLSRNLLGIKDRQRRKLLPSRSFDLLAYSLMPNHFHLLFQQKTEIPISDLMLNFTGGYSKCFNKKYGRVGSLFQDQFKATHIEDNTQLLHVSAYIHLNSTFAGLDNKEGMYTYSSYGEYLGNISGQNICKKELIASQFVSAVDYKSFVEESGETIRRNKELQEHLEDTQDFFEN